MDPYASALATTPVGPAGLSPAADEFDDVCFRARLDISFRGLPPLIALHLAADFTQSSDSFCEVVYILVDSRAFLCVSLKL